MAVAAQGQSSERQFACSVRQALRRSSRTCGSRSNIRTLSPLVLMLGLDGEVEALQGKGSQELQISRRGEDHLVDGERLVEPDDREA